jgi:hypothetical protein
VFIIILVSDSNLVSKTLSANVISGGSALDIKGEFARGKSSLAEAHWNG